jgi:ubiquinone/menaquinone biosynthesis C-methylase UbiE
MEHQEDNAASYDSICAWYEQVTKDSDYGVDYVSKAIEKNIIKKSALDVGCGVGGAILTNLICIGYKTTALDFSHKMLEIAKRRHPEIHFIEAELTVPP